MCIILQVLTYKKPPGFFPSGCAILHPHQQCRRATVCSRYSPTLGTVCLLSFSYSGGRVVVYYQVLICISLMTSFLFFAAFFFFRSIYLFLTVLLHGCCMQPFSSCPTQASHEVDSLVAEHGLQMLGLQQLQRVGSVVVVPGLQSTGSVVVVHRISCSKTRGAFWDQGLNWVSLALQGGFLTT